MRSAMKTILYVLVCAAAVPLAACWGAQDAPADAAQDAAAQDAAPTAPAEPVARLTEAERAEGFRALLSESGDGRFHKHGWNHYGPGHFTLDHDTGILASHGGMGLLWYAAEAFGDFTLRLEFRTGSPKSNSGVFLRVPEMVASDEYIYHSFEIQIDASSAEGIHRTGAVYDAEAPSEDRARPPGEWNDMEVSFVGSRITVTLNGAQVVDWSAEPRGKIRDFAARGYVGLQNHDWDTSTEFRNIRVKRLD